ncbi:GDSL-type esterase/lipase family protein [Paenibacillus sacheonensis]|uniref:Fibronectin type-III domain-containing protein n=1 Tax=Paenibacillus sacheonensis TaxID=742054 RepID=A0A7X4YT49_9BACL|nr:GDSL-type esterase/lipase family protein [Paenibacillus sacheonensis]MBM7568380.1 lysophospholipase L1-like esterase [Paenibacillus sacheonensis]NBC72080.1 hypothetical protein [Paenibacillus sacheonensis]
MSVSKVPGKLAAGLAFALLFTLFYANRPASAYDLTNNMTPFWSSTTMYNESVTMVSTNGGLPEAQLLFTPTSIISVRDSALGVTYQQGTDWTYDSSTNKIKLTSTTSAVYLTNGDMYPVGGADTQPKVGGGYVIFHEGIWFHEHQLAVTYTHNANVWNGPVPTYDASKLPNTLGKLQNGNPVKIALFGDSISAGANASNYYAPNLPSFGQLVADSLAARYSSAITYVNPSVGGTDSGWGAGNIHNLVSTGNPDLVILGFGMNDGSGYVSGASYKSHIQSMINDVKASNPNAEFILLAPMLANPETYFAGNQSAYLAELQSLSGTGIVTVNMTGVHQELLNHKKYADMTGNNVNHPNDFLIRWYAQMIAGTLIPGSTTGSPPAAPGSLTATAGSGQVALSWSASSGASSYTIKRGTSSGSYGTTVASGVTSTSYADTTVSNGTTYYYVVQAANGYGTSGNSSQASATPASSGGGSYAAQWNFDGSSLEGWNLANDVSGSATGGALHVNLTGGDPYILSPDNLGINASANGHVYVRLKNNTGSTNLQIYFSTAADGGFSESKAKVTPISANSGYADYDIDMSAVSGWSGTLKQIRMDFFDSSNSVDVDSVKIGGAGSSGPEAPGAPTGLSATGGNGQVALSWNAASGATSYTVKRGTSSGTYGTTVATGVTSTSYTDTTASNGTTYYYAVTASNSAGTSGNSAQASATPSGGGAYAAQWEFNGDGNYEGWSLANELTGSVSGGSLHLTSSGYDPYVVGPDNLGLSASANPTITIKVKNNTANTAGPRIYFTTAGDPNWSEGKHGEFTLVANSDYTIYTINMGAVSGWSGTIKQIRLDPIANTGTVDVDYIRVGS